MAFDGSSCDPELLRRMCRSLLHRGPDAEGIRLDAPVALGQRRLSIIDLSPSAVPPLSNEDQSIWIVFNGEIYNFLQLRQDLQDRGHRFRTRSDTETILHLYEQYGTACLDHLRGMFAFALWDGPRRRLFIARDRLGKKPLYYTRTGRAFIFGSEIKAITADPSVSVQPNFAAIDQYLAYQYVPSPLTAFEGIHKLPPGHYLLCDAQGDLTVQRYWSPPVAKASSAQPDELRHELIGRLRESVRLRMISDVPLGVFLSGGIDSGLVTALMAQESSSPIKTFSIGFEEASHNELPYARQVAQRYGTDHHEFIVKPDAAQVLPLLVRHYNEPFADSSALPTYYVSKMTRTKVTVALSGDGGDETFSGYDNYGILRQWSRLDKWPGPLRSVLFGLPAWMIQQAGLGMRLSRAVSALRMLSAPLNERFRLRASIFKPQERAALYAGELRRSAQRRRAAADLPPAPGEGLLDWMMRHDQNFYLPDCLMVKTDIASMANSLEVRSPFLDHKFVEFASTIPCHWKRDRLGGKRILKQAAESLLPADVLHKPKTGFGIPLERWLRGELRETVRDALLGQRFTQRGLFRPRVVRWMVEQHLEGRRNWSSRLWAILFLELWFREFID